MSIIFIYLKKGASVTFLKRFRRRLKYYFTCIKIHTCMIHLYKIYTLMKMFVASEEQTMNFITN